MSDPVLTQTVPHRDGALFSDGAGFSQPITLGFKTSAERGQLTLDPDGNAWGVQSPGAGTWTPQTDNEDGWTVNG